MSLIIVKTFGKFPRSLMRTAKKSKLAYFDPYFTPTLQARLESTHEIETKHLLTHRAELVF